MIAGVIFDIGGVLASDVSEYLFEHDGGAVIRKFGLDYEQAKAAGDTLWSKYAYTKEDPRVWQEIEQNYWSEFKEITGCTATIDELIQVMESCIKPTKGMPELLHWIKDQGLDLMICSNNTEFFYQHQMRIANFADIFEPHKVALSCRFGVAKDNEEAEVFKALEQKMSSPKAQYLFVDDRPGNIRAALKFGITPLFFPAEAEYGAKYVRSIIERMIS